MGKSDLHCELQQRCLVWLSVRATQRGIRGTEEVCLEEGYIADAAAISGLQMSQESLFIGKCERKHNDKISDDYAWVFESKVSRSDFFNTFKNNKHQRDRLNPIGNFHFVVTPKGMVTLDEVPSFWGLLEKSGQGLRLSKLPTYIDRTDEQIFRFAYSILRSRHESKFNIFADKIQQFMKEETEQLSIL